MWTQWAGPHEAAKQYHIGKILWAGLSGRTRPEPNNLNQAATTGRSHLCKCFLGRTTVIFFLAFEVADLRTDVHSPHEAIVIATSWSYRFVCDHKHFIHLLWMFFVCAHAIQQGMYLKERLRRNVSETLGV